MKDLALILAPTHVHVCNDVHVTVRRFLFSFNIIANLELHQICWDQPFYCTRGLHATFPTHQQIDSPFMEMRFHSANSLVQNSIVF